MSTTHLRRQTLSVVEKHYEDYKVLACISSLICEPRNPSYSAKVQSAHTQALNTALVATLLLSQNYRGW